MTSVFKEVGRGIGNIHREVARGTRSLLGVKTPNQPDDPPPPVVPDPPPTIDAAAGNVTEDMESKAREDADAQRRKKGRAAQVLTGDYGAGLPQTAAKQLLGE